MRILLFILTSLFILSCGKNDSNDPCIEITLDESVVLSNNDLVCINDIEYTFKAEDARCPCNISCAWEGEFIISIEAPSDCGVISQINQVNFTVLFQ